MSDRYEIKFSGGGRYLVESFVSTEESDYLRATRAVDIVLRGHEKLWPYKSPLSLFFLNRHRSRDGKYVAGEFQLNNKNPEDSAIYFGIEAIRKDGERTGLTFAPALVAVAGHEARHIVQYLEGEPLIGAPHTDPRHEHEAWIAAMNALVYIYPGSTGWIEVAGRGRFYFPERSAYEHLREH